RPRQPGRSWRATIRPSASTTTTIQAPTVPTCRCGIATARPRRTGRWSPTEPSGSTAPAWTSPTPAPPTAPWSSCGLAMAAPTSNGSASTGCWSTRYRADASTTRRSTPPTARNLRSGTATAARTSNGQSHDRSRRIAMTARADSQTDSRELASERVAGGILPRVLTTFDMVAIFVAIVLFINNSAAIQPAGPAAYGWWIIGFVVFLVPCAIATGQLGAMFPGEGSIYLWTHKAFGPFWGFFAGFCAWWPGVLVMVATGTSVIAFLGYAFPAVNNWPIQWQGVLIIGLIAASALLAILRFRVTQNVVNIVFVLYGLAILAMFAAGLVYLAKGNPA